MSMKDFEELINSYKYYKDPLWGLLDFTIQQPDFFFLERKSARDCDDWARMWYRWAKHRSYEAWEIGISYKIFGAGHMICVFEKDGLYYLADYRIRGKFDSLEKAVQATGEHAGWAVYRK